MGSRSQVRTQQYGVRAGGQCLSCLWRFGRKNRYFRTISILFVVSREKAWGVYALLVSSTSVSLRKCTVMAKPWL